MTEKLQFLPEQSGYAVTDPDQVVSIKLEGGASRQRADLVGAVHEVQATWRLNPEQFSAFQRFWIRNLNRGALPFLADLVLDTPFPIQYRCRAQPGSKRTTNVRGRSVEVSMRMEVDQPEYLIIANHQFGAGGSNVVSRTETADTPGYDVIFSPGDTVGVYAFIETPLAGDLSGVYTIDTIFNDDIFTLVNPGAINSFWNDIAGLGLSNVVFNAAVVKVDT